MSGSGGPGNSGDNDVWRPVATAGKPQGSGGNSGGSSNPCMFTEVTNLASPNRAVVSQLAVGSVLAVGLQDTPQRVVVTFDGHIAGSITSARLADLIECIRNGQGYQAKVTQISGGAVTVEIYPV